MFHVPPAGSSTINRQVRIESGELVGRVERSDATVVVVEL
jgi:hypothetical protein